jgi:hypothetical protein
MNQQLPIPNVEKVNVKPMSVRLSVDMTLADILVTVSGQYNIDSNCYYPATVRFYSDIDLPNDEFLLSDTAYSLENFCDFMGWDFWDTEAAIQTAVEERDR